MYGGTGLWLRSWQVEAGRSEVESVGTDYFREFEAILSYVRFYLKRKILSDTSRSKHNRCLW